MYLQVLKRESRKIFHFNLTAKLNSCKEEIVNVIGDTIPEHIVSQAVVRNHYNIQATLNELLNQNGIWWFFSYRTRLTCLNLYLSYAKYWKTWHLSYIFLLLHILCIHFIFIRGTKAPETTKNRPPSQQTRWLPASCRYHHKHEKALILLPQKASCNWIIIH